MNNQPDNYQQQIPNNNTFNPEPDGIDLISVIHFQALLNNKITN